MATELSNQHQTVFVVGAGASCEVGLPVGDQLKDHISTIARIEYKNGYERSSGDEVVDLALRDAAAAEGLGANERNELRRAGVRLASAMPLAISIDNYLDIHNGDSRIVLVGKLAIARAILSAERKSSMYADWRQPNQMINFGALKSTWFNRLFQALTENCRLDDLPARLARVTFVVFNYDRCIEHFLFFSLKNVYNIDDHDAAALVGSMAIFHPYGSVGPLSWAQGGAGAGVDFGADIHHSRLLSLAGELKTFTEGADESSSDIIAIRSAMRSATRTVFLGFAFHRLNLKLIYPNDSVGWQNTGTMLGTAYEVSSSDVALIRDDLARRSGTDATQITLDGLKCEELFRHYSRSLSMVV